MTTSAAQTTYLHVDVETNSDSELQVEDHMNSSSYRKRKAHDDHHHHHQHHYSAVSGGGADGGEELSSAELEDLYQLSRREKKARLLDPEQREEMRLRVNARERLRMHDLNSAMDSLRQVMPYAHGPSVKKLSKMATLLLARNYIVMLTRSVSELRLLLADAYRRQERAGLPTDATGLKHDPIAEFKRTMEAYVNTTLATGLPPAILPPLPAAAAAPLLSTSPETTAALLRHPPSAIHTPPHVHRESRVTSHLDTSSARASAFIAHAPSHHVRLSCPCHQCQRTVTSKLS